MDNIVLSQNINDLDNNPNNFYGIVNNNNNFNHRSFFELLTSNDFLYLSLDFIPSMIYISLILTANMFTHKPIESNFVLILRAFLFLYSAYIIKGLFHSLFIKLDKMGLNFYKFSISTFDSVLTICYYTIIVLAYFVFKERKEECFIQNTYMTSVLFYLLLIGTVNIAQDLLTLTIIVICFPIMVYYFTRDPNSFYSNIGIDPEIIANFPTIKADKSHSDTCAICTDQIREGDEILVLKCPGKHYFHSDCIKHWLVCKMSCPTCRCTNII